MAEITLDRLAKTYADDHEAVRDLDLDVADGEFMILVGPSGCGKSTALRMIAGLEDITSGELRIGGRLMNDVAAKDRDIAMVFQTYALYPHMTVRDNMGFSLRMAKLDKAAIARRVEAAARILDLTAQLDRRPANLSGGQRQRVAMGRAIVREPAAFLMDEPLSNLDAKLRVQMRAEIARIQERLGTTTIYVTHDQVEAMTLGDRVAVLHDGVLQQVAEPGRLYTDPANLFVATFIGSPAMNVFEGELGAGVVRTALGPLPLTDELRRRIDAAGSGERSVFVGVRPEHFADRRFADPSRRWFDFDAPVEQTEVVGADVYVHFGHTRDASRPADLERLAPDAVADPDGPAAAPLPIARLGPASAARPHTTIELSIDVVELHVFARSDGRCLTRSPDARTAGAGASSRAYAVS
jgi:multiple sugar transport system ATP-binding protein